MPFDDAVDAVLRSLLDESYVDAHDDIADIVLDLHEAAWTYGNVDAEDLLCVFDIGFVSPWGQHMRELQAYLHAEHVQRRLYA